MRHYDSEIEDYRKQTFDISVLKKLLPRFKPFLRSLIGCALLLAASSLLSLAGPLIVRHAIDVDFTNHDLGGLIQTSLLYLAVIAGAFALNYIQQVKLEIVGQAIVKDIRIDVFSHLTHLPQPFFDKHPVGQILSRVESDTEALRAMFTYTVVTILSDMVMMLGMFAVMFTLSPRLTLILMCVVPFVILAVKYFNARIVPIFIEVRKRMADIYANLEEYFRGVKIVQAFNREAYVIEHMNQVNQAKFNVEYSGERLSNYFGHIVFYFSILATILILGFGGHWALTKPELLSIGTLVAFLGYIQRFFGPIFHLSEQINVIQRAFAGAKRIIDILEFPRQDAATRESPPLTKPDTTETEAPAIEFRNVWFAYNPGEWVLKDVSFTVPKGGRTAVVGPTGSGKTTLISLLYRFYIPQKGTIYVDGKDILTIDLMDLRRKLGLVLQDIVLFPGSILENMRLENPDILEETVLNALKSVKADSVSRRSSEGVHGEISEYGANLSMGERQLLSYARALVHDPQILVLDEATSSVDPMTEQIVQSAMELLLENRTAFIIAHRLQTIMDADDILVVQNGQVVEQGTHRSLMEHTGIYWSMFQLQSGTMQEIMS
ncbi:ABC transporter ATP-binding protein [bacterium]|nr:ABC transporter ATP-binding protein [candidate division CSSED10-310 bacterium]